MGSATLTDEEVERVEKARAANGEAGERSMLDTIEAERAERLAAAAERDAEFDAAAPASAREEIDTAHAEQALESGEPSDVPGVEAGSGLDPAIGEEPLPDGSGSQLTFGVGGKRPTSVSLRIAGGKVGVTDEIRKGRLVRVIQEMRVGELHFVDKVDSKTGQVTACERRQILKPTAPPRVEILD